jgi:hypothetical protein
LVPLFNRLLRAESARIQGDRVSVGSLIPTIQFDVKLVEEAQGALERFKALGPSVLLMGGTRSARYLLTALDELSAVLPNAKRVDFPGLGHVAADDTGSPEVVASVLRSFFAESGPSES